MVLIIFFFLCIQLCLHKFVVQFRYNKCLKTLSIINYHVSSRIPPVWNGFFHHREALTRVNTISRHDNIPYLTDVWPWRSKREQKNEGRDKWNWRERWNCESLWFSVVSIELKHEQRAVYLADVWFTNSWTKMTSRVSRSWRVTRYDMRHQIWHASPDMTVTWDSSAKGDIMFRWKYRESNYVLTLETQSRSGRASYKDRIRPVSQLPVLWES